ncbi:hypothetical protein [Enemella evansiae]|uniref:hypothetical protein n=1 Tax=Enemella evansiae TaxID=2016499 RepID=UPI00118120F1|nr:hypothetical protein [Enemella evansiae]
MRRTPRRPLRVKARTQPRVPVAAIAAALFAFVALTLVALLGQGTVTGSGLLADTGSSLSAWGLGAIAVIVLVGIACLVIGRLGGDSHTD